MWLTKLFGAEPKKDTYATGYRVVKREKGVTTSACLYMRGRGECWDVREQINCYDGNGGHISPYPFSFTALFFDAVNKNSNYKLTYEEALNRMCAFMNRYTEPDINLRNENNGLLLRDAMLTGLVRRGEVKTLEG